VPADSLVRFVAHPLAVCAHVGGQPRGAFPAADSTVGEAREHGREPGELWRDFDQRLVDEHGDRVEVRGMRSKAEPLRLERDRPAAGEGVEDRGRVTVRRVQDLRVSFGEQLLIACVLPDDEALDDAVQSLALCALVGFGRKAVGV
jgi:hypothetical protein